MDMLVNLSITLQEETTVDNTSEKIEQLLLQDMGPRQKDLPSAILLTIVYSLIFVSGTVGNVCTCIIIVNTPSMQTTTNYYLFSLAVSDLLLLFFGLPPELYSIWEAYPWRLGVFFCYLRQTVLEITSYASVLTITSFTVERYLAVCHPLLAHKISALSRAVKIILGAWAIALVAAIPYTLHTRVYHRVFIPGTETPVPESLICSIPASFMAGFMYYMFQISTFLFFLIPITIIIILYIFIGVALRRSPACRHNTTDEKRPVGGSVPKRGNQHSAGGQQPRKVVIRMLVAVTVAFIVCWAPFHTQRLMIVYVTNWTPQMLLVNSHVFYISGVLYFVSSTVNPILYNVISKRYRAAFKKTIFPCCSSKTDHETTSNGRQTTRQLCPSQAMLVMRNGSSSLRLVFRQESQHPMPSYESIPLTPPLLPSDVPEMRKTSGSGDVTAYENSSTSSTSEYHPSQHRYSQSTCPPTPPSSPPPPPLQTLTPSNQPHHQHQHHHHNIQHQKQQRLWSVPEESWHGHSESDEETRTLTPNGLKSNVIENKDALRLMD